MILVSRNSNRKCVTPRSYPSGGARQRSISCVRTGGGDNENKSALRKRLAGWRRSARATEKESKKPREEETRRADDRPWKL